MSVRLVAVAIDEPGLDDDLVSRALAAAPPERAVAARRFRFGEDVRRAVLGDALVRVLAGRWFGVSPGEVRYGYGPQGKPRLAAREGFCFNVSHAGRYVLVGAGDAPVGVDVERIDPRLGFRQLAAMGRDVLAVEEQQALEESGEPRLFYRYWTLKESYLKFLGCGFSGSPVSFGVVERASGWTLRDAGEDAPRFVMCDLDEDHPAAVCTRAEIVEPVRCLSAAGVLTAAADDRRR